MKDTPGKARNRYEKFDPSHTAADLVQFLQCPRTSSLRVGVRMKQEKKPVSILIFSPFLAHSPALEDLTESHILDPRLRFCLHIHASNDWSFRKKRIKFSRAKDLRPFHPFKGKDKYITAFVEIRDILCDEC